MAARRFSFISSFVRYLEDSQLTSPSTLHRYLGSFTMKKHVSASGRTESPSPRSDGKRVSYSREADEESPVLLAEALQHLPEHLDVRRVGREGAPIARVALEGGDVDLRDAADASLELFVSHQAEHGGRDDRAEPVPHLAELLPALSQARLLHQLCVLVPPLKRHPHVLSSLEERDALPVGEDGHEGVLEELLELARADRLPVLISKLQRAPTRVVGCLEVLLVQLHPDQRLPHKRREVEAQQVLRPHRHPHELADEEEHVEQLGATGRRPWHKLVTVVSDARDGIGALDEEGKLWRLEVSTESRHRLPVRPLVSLVPLSLELDPPRHLVSLSEPRSRHIPQLSVRLHQDTVSADGRHERSSSHHKEHAVRQRQEDGRDGYVVTRVAQLSAHEEQGSFLGVCHDDRNRSRFLRPPHNVDELSSSTFNQRNVAFDFVLVS
eukprot:760281-Hanusia_phi.AAC.5